MYTPHCDLVVSGSNIITNAPRCQWADMDEVASARGVSVVVKDGLIVDILPTDEALVTWSCPPEKHVDLRGKGLLMPGLINAHTHVPMTFLRGFADDLPLLDWLTKHIFPIEAQLTREIVALSTRLGIYEMLRTGTTAFVDSYLYEDTVLNEANQMGMRCVGGEVLFGFPSRTYSTLDEAMALCRQHAAQYPATTSTGAPSLVQFALMPHSVYTTNDDVLKRCVRLAEELDLMLHIHLSESAGEVEQSRNQHDNRRPVAYAHDMGLLSSRTILAHMVDTTDDELALVAKAGAQIIHNPTSNLKLASGFARVSAMRQRGISVALGTDGPCSNNTLDMFETMKLAALLAKGCELDATQIPADQALRMATVEGARIFRQPGLGSLSIGAPADFIALDIREPNMCPMYHVNSHVVYAASGKDCILSVVAGHIRYSQQIGYTDGAYQDTRAQLNDLIRWVKTRAGLVATS